MGRRFARLTVLHIDQSRTKGKWRRAYWICQCECGALRSIRGESLRNGNTKSCGCLTRERLRSLLTTHHDSFTLEYKSWTAMIQRCTNPKNRSYPDYGGRGIKVCDRWRRSYENFLSDMGRRPSPKHSLDRINNHLGYSPTNCQWATREKQQNNKRTNRTITCHSITRTLPEWSRLTGIHPNTIRTRLDILGWTVGQALGFGPKPSHTTGTE